MKDDSSQVRRYFQGITPKARQEWKAKYEHALTPPVAIPHMEPHWREGLQILNEVIQELDQVTT